MEIGIVYKKEKLKNSTVPDLLIKGFLKRGVNAKIISDYDLLKNIDIALVLGGDGAIIHTAVAAARCGAKIVGINYGTLGFLTEYESKETERVISLICDGNYKILSRSIIKATCNGETSYSMNEVSLQRNALAPSSKKMIEFGVKINGENADDCLSDGMIVCTPTGSTAYSLSAGGAIMTPDLNAFMLTPICAFSLRSRPVVFNDSSKIEIKVNRVQDKALLFSDGKLVSELGYGDVVKIEKAEFTADFIQEESSLFFEKIKNKFGK